MIKRHLAKQILKYVKQYPILAVVGPRQSGKTTLAKALFPKHKYLSLENINLRKHAAEDPAGFLDTHGSHLILDEVQHVPELFSQLQVVVDENQEPGQYILTGSSELLLMKSVSQSLAGRIVTFKLLPLTYTELLGYKEDQNPSAIFRVEHPKHRKITQDKMFKMLLKGFYPRIHDKKLESDKWYESYVLAYLEKDIRLLLNVRNLRTFESFLLLCASRSGQLINYTDFSTSLGVSVSTIKEWISILQASGIIFILPPYFENFSKRIVKTPKLYFVDTGLLCHLLSVQTVDHLIAHPLLGQIFETFVVSEACKRFCNLGEKPPLYFWRDQSQSEIDLLIYDGLEAFPIEIKLSQTLQPSFRKPFETWMGLKNNPAKRGTVIYCGERAHTTQAISAYPWYLL